MVITEGDACWVACELVYTRARQGTDWQLRVLLSAQHQTRRMGRREKGGSYRAFSMINTRQKPAGSKLKKVLIITWHARLT